MSHRVQRPPAITLHQPWATLVVHGVKRYETRSWSTDYRGPLVIHAGKAQTSMGREVWEEYGHLIEQRTNKRPYARFEALPFGGIVGAVKLVGCEPTEVVTQRTDVVLEQLWEFHERDPYNYETFDQYRIAEELWDAEQDLGDFRRGRFAWAMAEPVAFGVSIPCRGHLSLWEPPDHVWAEARRATEAARLRQLREEMDRWTEEQRAAS